MASKGNYTTEGNRTPFLADVPSQEKRVNELIRNILKASLVGLLAVVITATPFEQFIGQFFGITFNEFGGGMPNAYLFPLFLIYTAIALTLAHIKNHLNISQRGAFFIIFAFHYFIVTFLPELEGEIYLPEFPFLQTIISGSILALAVVSLIFYLWKQDDNPEADVGQQIKSYFASRSVLSWLWRFFLVWLLFYVLTMLVGVVAYPFTKPYLDDPMNTLGMLVPSMATLFAITQFRSLVYILVTLPLIIFWQSGKKQLFLALALINVIQYPLLGDGLAHFWPVMYRVTDGIVLALQVTMMSWLYVALLWEGKKTDNPSS